MATKCSTMTIGPGMLRVMFTENAFWRVGMEGSEDIEWDYGSATIVSGEGLRSC